MAFMRSRVRLPSGPPNLRFMIRAEVAHRSGFAAKVGLPATERATVGKPKRVPITIARRLQKVAIVENAHVSKRCNRRRTIARGVDHDRRAQRVSVEVRESSRGSRGNEG